MRRVASLLLGAVLVLGAAAFGMKSGTANGSESTHRHHHHKHNRHHQKRVPNAASLRNTSW